MPKILKVAPSLISKVINGKQYKYWRVLVPKHLVERFGGKREHRWDPDDNGKSLADQFCRDINGALTGAKPGLVTLPAATQDALLRTLSILGGDPAMLDEAAALMMQKKNNTPGRVLTVKQATKECEEYYENLLAKGEIGDNYMGSFRCTLKKFAATFSERKVSDLTLAELDKWKNSAGNTVSSRLTYLSHIKAFFSWAKRIALCVKENPLEGVRAETRRNYVDPGVLSPDQAAKLLKAAWDFDNEVIERWSKEKIWNKLTGHYVGKKVKEKRGTCMTSFFAICLFAGIRPEEVQGLFNKDIDLKGENIEVTRENAKGRAGRRKRRIVKMLPVLRDWLESVSFQFPIRNCRRQFDEIRARAGLIRMEWPTGPIPRKVNPSAPGPAPKRPAKYYSQRYKVIETGWSHDCQRHSFISYFLAAFKDAKECALLVGHDDPDTMFEHYRAIRTPDGEKITEALAKEFFDLTPSKVLGLEGEAIPADKVIALKF